MQRPRALAPVLALVAITGVLTTPPAYAAPTPTVTIIAGTGTAGFGGDDGPATSAQLNAPKGLSVDAAGNVFAVDYVNRRIREVDTGGKMHTVVGDGSWCGTITDINLPLVGACPEGGVSVTPDGTAVYYGENNGISRAQIGGNAYRYAGRPYGPWTSTDDGDKFSVYVTGNNAVYDPTTGNVYYSQAHAIRGVTPGGQVFTVAGSKTDCNTGTDNTTPAIGGCLWPRELAVHNGHVYFTEQSEWNGPRARIVDGDTIRTLAGNGSWGDPTLGGPATASGFPSDTVGIAVDSHGNLYLSGFSRGRVWKVDAQASTLSFVHEFVGGAGWLAVDTQDNLYASLQYLHQIAKISGLVDPPAPPPSPKLKIAVLGDSVAGAEGTRYRWHYDLDPGKKNGKNGVWNGKWVADELNPVWEPTNDLTPTVQACHRSTDGYPYKVAAALNADLLNLACSGAGAENGILHHQVFGDYSQAAQPQLGTTEVAVGYDPPNKAYDDFRPDVVLLTVGADDINFTKYVEACYRSVQQGLAKFCDKDPRLNAQIKGQLAEQKQGLERVITEIVQRGKASGKVPQIAVTTYYDPFPVSYVRCQDITPKLGMFGLSKGEMNWLKGNLRLLNDNVTEVARTHPEVILIDLTDAFVGHQWCSKDPWVFGPSIALQDSQSDNPSPFHPTWYGQTVIGDKITQELSIRLG